MKVRLDCILFFFFHFPFQHNTDHLNRSYVSSSVALNIFILLCNRHPSPDLFLSP